MIRKIDHVSIVARDINKMISKFQQVFGFEISEDISFPEQGFHSVLITKEDVTIEFVEPLDSNSPIAKFLGDKESALHHFSMRVDNIEKDQEVFESLGLRLVSKEPKSPTEKSKANFVHPASTGGILIELIERSK